MHGGGMRRGLKLMRFTLLVGSRSFCPCLALCQHIQAELSNNQVHFGNRMGEIWISTKLI